MKIQKNTSRMTIFFLFLFFLGCGPNQNNRQTVKVITPETNQNDLMVESVSVFPESISLTEGESKIISATVKYNDGSTNSEIDWNSSDKSIVTIDNTGNLKGLKEGNAFITVVSKQDIQKKAHVSVVVKANDENDSEQENSNLVSSIEIKADRQNLKVGESIKLIANIVKSDGSSDNSSIWRSFHTDIAIVDPEGNVKAISAGEAKIEAKAKLDETKKATILITVVEDNATAQIQTDKG